MAFLTIQPTPGLDARQRRRANRVGPVAVAVPTSYESLLHTAGFVDVLATDLTGEYRSTQHRWIDATLRYGDAIREVVGDEAYDDRARTRHATLEAIDAGLLSRFLYTATRR